MRGIGLASFVFRTFARGFPLVVPIVLLRGRLEGAGEDVFERHLEFGRIRRYMRFEARHHFAGAIHDELGVAPVNIASCWSLFVAG